MGSLPDLSCFIFTVSGRQHSTEMSWCLMRWRATDAASFVLKLQSRKQEKMHLVQGEWFQVIKTKPFFISGYIPSDLPKDYFLHKGHCGYGLHLLPPLPREELSVLEVVEHDDEKAHVVIRLEREKNRVQSLKINTSVLTCEQQMDCLFRCSNWGIAIYQEWFRKQIMDGRWPVTSWLLLQVYQHLPDFS